LFLIICVLVLALPLQGCSSDGQASNDAASPQASKYERPSGSEYPTFATVESAAAEVGFAPKKPKRVGQPVKVVVRDTGRGKSLTKSERPMDIHYESFWIAEAPFATPSEASAQLDMMMYLREVEVHGNRALAHDPVDTPLVEESDGTSHGGLKVEGSSVVWADGKMLYNITSATLPYRELVEIGESMYE
jgi:hypothetical protein